MILASCSIHTRKSDAAFAMEQHVNQYIMLACGSVYLSAAERLMLAPLIAQRTKEIRFMLLEAVLVISDGVEAVLSSAADALIQPLLLQ